MPPPPTTSYRAMYRTICKSSVKCDIFLQFQDKPNLNLVNLAYVLDMFFLCLLRECLSPGHTFTSQNIGGVLFSSSYQTKSKVYDLINLSRFWRNTTTVVSYDLSEEIRV